MADMFAGYPPKIRELHARWLAGVRARDWPAADLEECLEEVRGELGEDYVLLMAYYQALDFGRLDAAHVHIRKCYAEATGNPAYRQSSFSQRITLEYAYMLSILDTALPKAKWLIDSVELPLLGPKPTYLRAKAAFALATGSSEADDLLTEAEENVRRDPNRDLDTLQAEAEWLEGLRRLQYRYES